MGFVTLPHNLVDGVDTALGSDVKANDDAIVSVVNGGLDYQNMSGTANLLGSMLANATIPETKLIDDSVSAAKLRDDASVDANRAVTANHIRDGVISGGSGAGAKIAANTITGANLKIGSYTATLNGSGVYDTGVVAAANLIPLGIYLAPNGTHPGAPGIVTCDFYLFLNFTTQHYYIVITGTLDAAGYFAVFKYLQAT